MRSWRTKCWLNLLTQRTSPLLFRYLILIILPYYTVYTLLSGQLHTETLLPWQLHNVTMTTTHCYHDSYILLPWQLHIVTMTTIHCYHDNYILLPWQLHTVIMTTIHCFHDNYTLLLCQLHTVTMTTTHCYHGNPQDYQSTYADSNFIHYSTRDGSAKKNLDYEPVSGVLVSHLNKFITLWYRLPWYSSKN